MSNNGTTTTTITVAGMTCGHCTASVEDGIRKIDGVEAVAADVETGVVTVESVRPTSTEELEAAVAEAGYEVVS